MLPLTSNGILFTLYSRTNNSKSQARPRTQMIPQPSSGMDVTGPTTVSDAIAATITCTLSDVTETTTVSWLGGDISGSLSARDANKYTLASGSWDSFTKTQSHTLVISSASLVKVRANVAKASTTYTCRFKPVATVDLDETQSLNIISPSK
jgi:hypothetical protein